ncbi:MAG: radical SAM protein [Chitinispirillaceae bacterium]|nr:radical SAM protein [Chitinispirillaceae bacterium]
MKTPILIACDDAGNAIEIPELRMAVSSNGRLQLPDDRSLIPLPKSGVLFTLPARAPAGYDPVAGRFVFVKEYGGKPVTAAAAFMPPGYVQTHTSAFREMDGAPRLPLYCYAAVGWMNGRFYAAGCRIDRQSRHEIPDELLGTIDRMAKRMLERYAHNRLVAHLVNNCVLTYRCPNACNFALGRWECPVPVSPACNAACLGCISLQPKGSGVPSTQHRIDFVPTAGEIAEYVVPHLKHAAHPIASFGQGCEGEPLLQARVIEESIRKIRGRTKRGIINMNTNASCPAEIERLCAAGLDSMRVSLNSAQRDFYHAYYRPKGYSFDDVVESIKIARRNKVWVSLNYLVFPGFTDSRAEFSALGKFVTKTGINMIQTRNLNIDPVWYSDSLGIGRRSGRPLGMVDWITAVRKEFPAVKLGYFNPTAAAVRAWRG